MLCSGKDSLILLVISLSASISVCVTRLETSPLDLNDLIFLDDKLLWEGEDKAEPKFQPSGRIGFICHETNPYFDNLVIEGDQIIDQIVKEEK